MNSDEIRRGLWSIRTRSSTIDAVAGAGASMIDLLLPILQDRTEGVRWSVVKLLGEIGDEPELWRQWLMQDPELRNAESIGILFEEDLVREAVQDLPVTLSGSSPAFIAQTSRWPSNGASRSGSISPARTRAVNLVADDQPRAF